MANAKQLFQAMKPGCVYRVYDLAATLREPPDSIRKMLATFVKGGLSMKSLGTASAGSACIQPNKGACCD